MLTVGHVHLATQLVPVAHVFWLRLFTLLKTEALKKALLLYVLVAVKPLQWQ